jgi:uncharacterized protein (DUF849 family)
MSTTQDKVIISCAVTGSVHTPSDVALPAAHADDIAEQAIEAAEAGAAILHLHARNPEDGSPTADPRVFDQFVPRIRAATDAVINITTGGSIRMTLAERLAYPLQAQPEMCSLNMGSMNFSIHPAARKIRSGARLGEALHRRHGRPDLPQHLQGHQAHPEGAGRGLRHAFRVRVLRPGPSLHLAHFVDEGLIKGPLFIQCIFGILGGMGPTRKTWR